MTISSYWRGDAARRSKLTVGTVVPSSLPPVVTRATSEAGHLRRCVGWPLDEWLDGLRLAETTAASYRKNVRLHVKPYIGSIRLDHVTPAKLTALYRELETSGRRCGTGSLGPRTVRYVHTIVHKALSDAVRDGVLAANPADRAKLRRSRKRAHQRW